ncbi:MAG: hypothetical protein EOO11_21585 [Chitinophagaceae bacterium]|nr:MAG: hypothetical protein EOO11_21585 [Chitinophagaceae bacterium]
MCSIILVPEGRNEENLLTQQDEGAFTGHYQQALTKYVHADASLVAIVNKEHFPKHVLVQYAVAGQ